MVAPFALRRSAPCARRAVITTTMRCRQRRVASRGDSAPGYIDISTARATSWCAKRCHARSSAGSITAEQIQTVYVLNGECWPFPAAAPSQRVEWEGEPSKLLELQLMLQHIDAAELGYMDYLSVVAGVHQDFGGASDALDMLLDSGAPIRTKQRTSGTRLPLGDLQAP